MTNFGVCAECGVSLAGRRATTKTCSDKCRKRLYRRNHKTSKPVERIAVMGNMTHSKVPQDFAVNGSGPSGVTFENHPRIGAQPEPAPRAPFLRRVVSRLFQWL